MPSLTLAVPKDQLQVGSCSSSSGHRLEKQGKQFPASLANFLLASTLQPIPGPTEVRDGRMCML